MDIPLGEEEELDEFFEEEDIKPDVKPEPEDLYHALYGHVPPSDDLWDVYPAPGVGIIEEPFVDLLPLIDYDDLQMALCDVKECSVVLERTNTDEQDVELAQVMKTMSIQDLPRNEVAVDDAITNAAEERQEIVTEILPNPPDNYHPLEIGELLGSEERALQEVGITAVAGELQEPRKGTMPPKGDGSKNKFRESSPLSAHLPSSLNLENRQVSGEIVTLDSNGNMDQVSPGTASSSDLGLPCTRTRAKRRKENVPTPPNEGVPPSMKKCKVENLQAREGDQLKVEIFACPICGIQSSFKGSVKRHIASKHKTPVGEKPYKCLLCGWRCKWPDTIHPHVQARHLEADQAYRAGNFVTLSSSCSTCGE